MKVQCKMYGLIKCTGYASMEGFSSWENYQISYRVRVIEVLRDCFIKDNGLVCYTTEAVKLVPPGEG